MPPPHGRVAHNAIVYLLAQVLSWSVTFLTVSLIPRRLGEAGMGQLAIASTITGTVAAIFALGMDNFLIVEVGRNHANGERLTRSSWGLRIALLIPQAITILVVMRLMHVSHTVLLLGWITIGGSVIGCMLGPVRSILAGWEEARRASTIDLANAASPLLALPFLSSGPASLSVALVVTNTVAIFCAVRYVRKRIRFSPIATISTWRILIAGGLPFLLNDAMMQLYGFGSVTVLRLFTDEAAIGQFNQALRLQGTLMFVPTAIGSAMLPSLARLSDSSEQEFRRLQSRILGLMTAIALPVATGVIMLATPFCHLLYGPRKFLMVPLALQVSALNVIPLYINIVIYRFLVAQRKNLIWSFFLLGTVALNAGLCYVLVPIAAIRYGNPPVGAMASSLIAECLTAVAAFVLLRNNPLTRDTIGTIFRSFAATAGMAATLWIVRGWGFFVPFILGSGVFVLLGWSFHVLGPEEQARLATVLHGLSPWRARSKS